MLSVFLFLLWSTLCLIALLMPSLSPVAKIPQALLWVSPLFLFLTPPLFLSVSESLSVSLCVSESLSVCLCLYIVLSKQLLSLVVNTICK